MPGQLDRDAIRSRAAAAESKLGETELDERRREAIFARRAEALAAPPPPDAPLDALEVLIFPLGGERYAFPSVQVHEARVVHALTTLPDAPPFVAGLVNVRGRVITVLDLRPLLGVRSGTEIARTVLLVAGPRGDVGILATDRPVVGWLRRSELSDAPAGAAPGLDPACVRGVTPDLIVLLDGARLLADPRLIVREEIELR